MGHDITLHSRFNRIVAVIVWALSAFMVGSAVVAGDARFVSLYPAAALLAFFAWAALWRPYVRVGDSGVTLRNVTHHVDVAWAALVHVDTRYALTLHTPAGKFAAWAAPAQASSARCVHGAATATARRGRRASRCAPETSSARNPAMPPSWCASSGAAASTRAASRPAWPTRSRCAARGCARAGAFAVLLAATVWALVATS